MAPTEWTDALSESPSETPTFDPSMQPVLTSPPIGRPTLNPSTALTACLSFAPHLKTQPSMEPTVERTLGPTPELSSTSSCGLTSAPTLTPGTLLGREMGGPSMQPSTFDAVELAEEIDACITGNAEDPISSVSCVLPLSETPSLMPSIDVADGYVHIDIDMDGPPVVVTHDPVAVRTQHGWPGRAGPIAVAHKHKLPARRRLFSCTTDVPGTAGSILMVHGTNFGLEDTTPLPRIGNSRCVMASWHSETTLICKVNDGGGSARFAALTIGMRVGTVGTQFSSIEHGIDVLSGLVPRQHGIEHGIDVLSGLVPRQHYNTPIITTMFGASTPPSALAPLTVLDSNFVPTDRSLTASVSASTCATTSWSSASTVVCTVPSGHDCGAYVSAQANGAASTQTSITLINSNLVSLDLTPTANADQLHTAVTVAHTIGTLPLAFSYDAPLLSDAAPADVAVSARLDVSISGLNFVALGSSTRCRWLCCRWPCCRQYRIPSDLGQHREPHLSTPSTSSSAPWLEQSLDLSIGITACATPSMSTSAPQLGPQPRSQHWHHSLCHAFDTIVGTLAGETASTSTSASQLVPHLQHHHWHHGLCHSLNVNLGTTASATARQQQHQQQQVRQGPDIMIAGVDPSAGSQARGTTTPRHIEEDSNLMIAGVDPSAGGYAREATLLPSECGPGSWSLARMCQSRRGLEAARRQFGHSADTQEREVPATGLCLDYSLLLVLMLTYPQRARNYLLYNEGQMGQLAWCPAGARGTQPETVLTFICRTSDSMIIRALQANSTGLPRLSRVLDQLLLFARMRLLSDHARLSGCRDIDMSQDHPTHEQLTQRKYPPATMLMQTLMVKHLKMDLWITLLASNGARQLHTPSRHPGTFACKGTTQQPLLVVHLAVEINHGAGTPVVGHCWPFVSAALAAQGDEGQDEWMTPARGLEIRVQTQLADGSDTSLVFFVSDEGGYPAVQRQLQSMRSASKEMARMPALGGRHSDSPKLKIERKFSLSPTRYKELSRTAPEASSKQHQDLYFDTLTYQLSQRDWWLRLRDNRWELKVPARRGADEGVTTSTQFWELEEETLICQQLGILSLPDRQRRLDLVQEVAFGTRLVNGDDEGLKADFSTTSGGTRHLFFHLCANMETHRLSVVSPSDNRITMALDAVTFHPPWADDHMAGNAPDFHICELEIMLKSGEPEARRLAEVALDKEVQRLHLSAHPQGRSKLFTYPQQYSPIQHQIWQLRHNEQELRPLLAEAGLRRPPGQGSSPPSRWSNDPMRVPEFSPLGDEHEAVLMRPFALEQFQDVGILESVECDIRADLSETSDCEVFLKSVLKDSDDKSDEEQAPMHCAGVAVFASMSEYAKETQQEEHTLQHHRDQDKIPRACFGRSDYQQYQGQGRAWLDAVSLLGQSGVQYSTLLSANDRAQMRVILDMGAEYPIICRNCVTLEQWAEAWPCTSKTMGIGGLRRYRADWEPATTSGRRALSVFWRYSAVLWGPSTPNPTQISWKPLILKNWLIYPASCGYVAVLPHVAQVRFWRPKRPHSE